MGMRNFKTFVKMNTNGNTIKRASLIVAALLFASIWLVSDAAAQWFKKTAKPEEHITLVTNPGGEGPELDVTFIKGSGFNHPLMVFWIEDLEGNYIQTLYVSRSIARGVYDYGDKHTGRWMPGEISRPAALPYWAHKRNILNDIGNYMPKPGFEVADAYSGATPKASFTLETRPDKSVSGKFRILMEINQTWDWNRYWTNNKFPGDKEYRTSSQPAVVYAAELDPQEKCVEVVMKPIGRSHHSGADGRLYSDLETLTTALQIASEVRVKLK
jgi:hypothetical protein